MNKNQELQSRKEHAVAKGQANLFPIYTSKAKGAELWDIEGNRYIDFGSGIAVTNTGHNHPKVQKAIHDQLEAFDHTCFMVNPYASAVKLAEELNELAPIKGAKTAFFSTGAEAVENAIKIAKAYTKRHGVISFQGAFHGRTNMCLGLTGKMSPYKKGFGSFPNDIFHIPFPIEHYGITTEDALQALDALFSCSIDPSDVAAMIIEPTQGEGGFHTAPVAFLRRLRSICDAHGILLICDEVQTGFARTGTFFATEKYDIEPDIIAMAKGLAAGMPLSAVTGKAAMMDASGSLGGTYGGTPIGCVSALAVLEVIKEENLCEKATRIGENVTRRLNVLQQTFPQHIGHVRNSGAMIAVEFVKNGDIKTPDTALTKAIIQESAKKGLIILSCGRNGNVIRILTPLTIPSDVLEEGLNIFEAVIKKLCNQKLKEAVL